MWRSSVECFASVYGISLSQARQFQCTAEHLVARQDGGRDGRSNIVAACLSCNSRRHRRKCAPEPIAYRALVQARISRGGWHPCIGQLSAIQSPRISGETASGDP
ncbi:HNH endonuclease [Pseudomonas abieticivorans]|uniref:HNH endonuclease n=1 Tax=Pseudomonas abieticivorans TaxID=2931382 RepID=UPI0020C0B63B|nr:HNH endonuclease [Pseudomonas sp. PIA16]